VDLNETLANVGQFLQSPQMPVLAGQMGAAAMGPNQASWQANLGRVASGFGQSAIAANEAKAQGNKSAQMNEWLKQILPSIMSGVNHTPAGVAGPTETNIKVAGNDYTATTKGQIGTEGGNAPAGAPVGTNSVLPNTQPKQFVAPQQTQAPQINPRLLPFF
jgi:hypothetical protein